jgi:hypothetical protein
MGRPERKVDQYSSYSFMGIRGYTFTKNSSKGFDFSCGLQFEGVCYFPVAVFSELFAFCTSVNFISTDDHELAGGGGNSAFDIDARRRDTDAATTGSTRVVLAPP